jgi:hypothetical protein
VEQVPGGVDELAYFLLAQHDRESAGRFGKGNILQHVMPPQGFHEQEPERRHSLDNAPGAELLLLQKVALKASDVVRTELIWWPVEVLGELPDRHQVRPYGSLRVITTLEFLQHHLA